MLRNIKRTVAESINYRIELRHDAHRVAVPVVAGLGRSNRNKHEPHLFAVLDGLHAREPGGLLVDIGVNIGQTLIKYALIAGPNCRYIGFEPNPKAASYAGEIIRCNHLANAQIIPVALGSRTMLASLMLNGANSTDSMASIKEGFRDASFYKARQLVPVFQGDEVLQSLGVQDRYFTVKIDVEGGELDVLGGMQRTLRELRPFVIVEILPPREKFSAAVRSFRLAQAVEIKALMRSSGYDIRRIGTTGTLVDADAPGSDDFLFVPKERLGSTTT